MRGTLKRPSQRHGGKDDQPISSQRVRRGGSHRKKKGRAGLIRHRRGRRKRGFEAPVIGVIILTSILTPHGRRE